MSFGFAIGDFIAVLGLFERIAIELRNYRDAPARFQNLIVELDLLRSTLKHVLQAQTDDQSDELIVERIRAIVTHCHQPLLAFVDKLRSKERSLGHNRTARLSDVGIRMKWSMVTQKDVDELRKILLSEMLAINMLLSVQHLTSMRRLSSRMIESPQSLLAIDDKTSTMLTLVQSIPGSIADLHLTVTRHGEQQTKRGMHLMQAVTRLSSQVTKIFHQGDHTLQMIQHGGAQITRVMARVSSILSDLRKLMYLLSKCSKDMLAAIQQNTRLLLDMAAHMKRIARAIESIPLHLSLDIIRLDDALGESWGLPMQACQTWQSFKNLLTVVVYANERPGLNHIVQGQFQVTLAKTGRKIMENNQWTSIVKAGAHLQQAMIVPELPYMEGACPHSDCAGTLVSEIGEIDKKCSTCGRITNTERLVPQLLRVYPETWLDPILPNEDEPPPAQTSAQQTRPHHSTRSIRPIIDHTHLFRRIQIYERQPPLSSKEEAYEKLAEDASHFQANLYLGWHALRINSNDEAIRRLKQAVAADDGDWVTFYLLARAFLELDRRTEAHDALQQAVYRNGRVPDIWITVAILFFMEDQYRDSLDALARSVRFNAHTWESWYNLGVLYDHCRQPTDVLDALGRASELNPSHLESRRRIEELKGLQPGASGEHLNIMIHCELLHISEPIPVFIEDESIHVNPLNLEDEEEWLTEREGNGDAGDVFESDDDDVLHYIMSDAEV
ncbi:transcriptional corepressor ssn6 [Colletotrichum scovillei]|uniref:Transcriptional corepressor ssn6 n=1 Tax=Colletotrichum scovillei TaxID=1209932 RepID=A0A9P7RIN7_9PEZI|nr:transcriptional corepressor ssn6 [Colletotrichum scovillei]KAG7076490.1 transcriptional corepressor ssn6 [Colletotrichum scovillei]KAG7083612.1 transcriptional corepressor ssn6 [Colletotrichum scovillei]